MSTARRLHYSYEEYLRVLELSPLKLEYCEGEIYAMAGGTPAHADLAAAMIHVLVHSLGEECRVSTSDLKVRIAATGLSTFPEVTVVCGPREAASNDPNAVTNPTLLVEVTSRSTEEYDRGEKLRHYQHLETLQAVLYVSHVAPRITVVERAATGWNQRDVGPGEDVVLAQPALRLSVDEVYRGVVLDGAV